MLAKLILNTLSAKIMFISWAITCIIETLLQYLYTKNPNNHSGNAHSVKLTHCTIIHPR